MECRASITYRFKEDRPEGNTNPYDAFWKFVDNCDRVREYEFPTTSTVYVKFPATTQALCVELRDFLKSEGIVLIEEDEIAIEGHNEQNELEAILFIEKNNKIGQDKGLNRFFGLPDIDLSKLNS